MSVLVVHAHPLDRSFSGAVRDAITAGLRSGGHEHRVLEIWGGGFDADHPTGNPDVLRLDGAEHVVFVHPTWWSGQPAPLLAWLAAVAPAEWAAVSRLTAVTTHGSSRWVNLLEGRTGRTIYRRTIAASCRPGTRLDWIAMYSMDRAGESDRAAFLRRVERRVTR